MTNIEKLGRCEIRNTLLVFFVLFVMQRTNYQHHKLCFILIVNTVKNLYEFPRNNTECNQQLNAYCLLKTTTKLYVQRKAVGIFHSCIKVLRELNHHSIQCIIIIHIHTQQLIFILQTTYIQDTTYNMLQ